MGSSKFMACSVGSCARLGMLMAADMRDLGVGRGLSRGIGLGSGLLFCGLVSGFLKGSSSFAVTDRLVRDGGRMMVGFFLIRI